MPHWKSLMDRNYLFSFDLQGRDVTLTIEKVVGGELVSEGGRKSKKPLVYFKEGKEKRPLAMNVTNCKTVASLYGNDVADWIGKRVTLFPTQTQKGNETVDCIRIRPTIPTGKAAAPKEPESEPSDNEGVL